MGTETEHEPASPWFLRGKSLIIGAGALAAAVLAVLGLWDRLSPPDLVDMAKIESVEILEKASLSEFASTLSADSGTAAGLVNPLSSENTDPFDLHGLTSSHPIDPRHPDGGSLDPEEVGKRLNEARSSASPEPAGTAPAGAEDPDGWIVAVNVNLEGFQGVPLVLTWSLDGIDVPGDWEAENVGYELTPSTARDAGSVEIWVPELGSGGHNVNVELALASDGTVVARGKPLALPNP